MSGAGADELAAFTGEEVRKLMGVLSLERGSGEDHGAGVDIFARKPRIAIPAGDPLLERGSVNRLTFGIRRENDGGPVQHQPLDHDIATRQRIGEPLQPKPGEHRVAGRRADVDPHRAQDDVIRLALFQATGQSIRMDRLVIVAMRVRQAGWNTLSIREGSSRARSSSS